MPSPYELVTLNTSRVNTLADGPLAGCMGNPLMPNTIQSTSGFPIHPLEARFTYYLELRTYFEGQKFHWLVLVEKCNLVGGKL